MNALLITALLGVDLVITETDAPAPQLVITDTASGCKCGGDCGPGCPCKEGECVKPATANVRSSPDLIATVADRGCGPCVLYEEGPHKELTDKGWNIELRRVPLGSEDVPKFEFQGRTLVGYDGRDAFMAWLKSRPLPSGTTSGNQQVETKTPAFSAVAVVPLAGTSKSIPAPIHRSIPPARRTWNYSGSDLAGHLRREHGVDPSGMSHSEMVRAHSHAHEGTWGGVSGGYAYSAPVRRYSAPAMRSGCPGGNCPTSSSRSSGGFFRRLFR